MDCRKNSPVSGSKIPSWAVAAIGADERPLGRAAVGDGQLVKVAVAGLAGGVEDERDVHHDVDEQALRGDERAKVSSPLVESHAPGCGRR